MKPAKADSTEFKARKEWVERVLGVAFAPSAATPALSLVRLGKARVAYIGVQRQALAGLSRLRETLRARYADDSSQQKQWQDADKTLADLAVRLDSALNDELDTVLNEADPGKRADLANRARGTLRGLSDLVASHPVMRELDGNEVLPDMAVTAPLAERLRAIEAALG